MPPGLFSQRPGITRLMGGCGIHAHALPEKTSKWLPRTVKQVSYRYEALPMTVKLDLRLRDEVLASAIRSAPWSSATGITITEGRTPPDVIMVVCDHSLGVADEQQLLKQAEGVPVLLLGPTLARLGGGSSLADSSGVVPVGVSPRHEIRLRPGADVDPRRQGDVTIRDIVTLIGKTHDDVVVTATCDVALATHPVAVWRAGTGVGVFSVGCDPATWSERGFLRLLHRWVRSVTGKAEGPAVRVGMLGYGAIGHQHNGAIQAVPGLELTALCDRNPQRVADGQHLAPAARVVNDAAELMAADDIDLVMVSTPPDSHHRWARLALRSGKHVVVEKPMALTSAQCDDLLAVAEENNRLLLVYQNRRWDSDYLALRKLVLAGRIGEVFHLESFIGGYGHPCNYWHSDAAVSGGAIFDWGSHILDQVLDLLPGDVEHVTAADHQRVWHDVTNADHSRVTLRMTGGAEAEFVHSDVAAALKPRWYVLGTEGAVVGRWRQERVVRRNEVGTLDEDVLAPADSPCDLLLHAPDGSVAELAVPPAPLYPFHRELADTLLSGLPTTVNPKDSRRVVAVMEAAERSARENGQPVVPA
jgi:scyllo-inositol 2-dehydrogenase (NADP+)